MEAALFYWFTSLFAYGGAAADPAQLAFIDKQAARSMSCERMTQSEAHALYPNEIPVPHARSSAILQIDALVCGYPVIGYGLREPREALILEKLSAEVDALTALATTTTDTKLLWHVDAFYPEPRMVQKIANAVRINLRERGQRVASQAPLLAAGDILVLRDRHIRDALPVACGRYFDEGTLTSRDAFLGVALLDPRETQLHAGTCVEGKWRWLR